MKAKLFAEWIFLGLLFFFQSCASTAKFKGEGDLCGIIVDEKNLPVSGYFISCQKNGMPSGNAITSESGLFIIQNLKCGKYVLDGKKINCTDIKNLEVNFRDRKSILCCKALTADGLFERVESLVMAGDFKQARRELKNLRYEGNTYVEKMIVVYKGWISAMEKDRKSALVDIKRMKRFREAGIGDFAEKLEGLLDGE